MGGGSKGRWRQHVEGGGMRGGVAGQRGWAACREWVACTMTGRDASIGLGTHERGQEHGRQ